MRGKHVNVIAPKRPKMKVGTKKAPRRRVGRANANDLVGGFSAGSEFKVRKSRKKKISAAESLLRIQRVRRGDANNRIEGISSDPQANTVFAAYISGDIEVTEIVPRLKSLYCVP
jgi:hypothetical protein